MNMSSWIEGSLQSGAEAFNSDAGNALRRDFPSDPTPEEECSSSSEGDDADPQVPPRATASSDAAVSLSRRRVKSQSNLPFEEQLALQEIRSAKTDSFSNSSDGAISAGASPPSKNAGFGLRSIMARMFRGSRSRAAPKSGSAASTVSDDAESWVDIGSVCGMSQEEIVERVAKTRAEQIYDAPFAHLSEILMKRRYRNLNAEICSLDWLSGDVDIEFEVKAQRMKLRLADLLDLAAKNKSFRKGLDDSTLKNFLDWKLTKQAYSRMFPVHEFNDVILEARIRQLQFLQPCHLDLESTWNEHFEAGAMSALKQMQHCHRPLDKLLCLNDTSRLVCNMIGYQDSDDGASVFPGADDFFPPFLLLLIRTNPPHLVSTIDYCCQLMEGSWSEYPNLEILLSHLEACKQFVLTCTENSFTGDAQELKRLLQCAEEEFPLPLLGGSGDGIVVMEEQQPDQTSSLRLWLGLANRGTASQQPPRRLAETLRIIDSTQERMSKKNREKSDLAGKGSIEK